MPFCEDCNEQKPSYHQLVPTGKGHRWRKIPGGREYEQGVAPVKKILFHLLDDNNEDQSFQLNREEVTIRNCYANCARLPCYWMYPIDERPFIIFLYTGDHEIEMYDETTGQTTMTTTDSHWAVVDRETLQQGLAEVSNPLLPYIQDIVLSFDFLLEHGQGELPTTTAYHRHTGIPLPMGTVYKHPFETGTPAAYRMITTGTGDPGTEQQMVSGPSMRDAIAGQPIRRRAIPQGQEGCQSGCADRPNYDGHSTANCPRSAWRYGVGRSGLGQFGRPDHWPSDSTGEVHGDRAKNKCYVCSNIVPSAHSSLNCPYRHPVSLEERYSCWNCGEVHLRDSTGSAVVRQGLKNCRYPRYNPVTGRRRQSYPSNVTLGETLAWIDGMVAETYVIPKEFRMVDQQGDAEHWSITRARLAEFAKNVRRMMGFLPDPDVQVEEVEPPQQGPQPPQGPPRSFASLTSFDISLGSWFDDVLAKEDDEELAGRVSALALSTGNTSQQVTTSQQAATSSSTPSTSRLKPVISPPLRGSALQSIKNQIIQKNEKILAALGYRVNLGRAMYKPPEKR